MEEQNLNNSLTSGSLISTPRVRVTACTDNLAGKIRWDAPKSLFYIAMLVSGILTLPAAGIHDWLVFFAMTGITILMGHSVGMHRLLIHRSFKTPRWLEYVLVYLGVLVGMAGPFGMIRQHDIRDWHQRQNRCPPFPSHGTGFFRDGFWQLHCRFELDNPPEFQIEPEIRQSRFYVFLEKTWMLQQLPPAVILFLIGGWPMAGLCVGLRVVVSLTGHWIVGHFAHKRGQQPWIIEGLPVQGYNLPYLSWITFGENWHGNHHAYPESAILGFGPNQNDPGFLFIRTLECLGLTWSIKRPDNCEKRKGLRRIA